MERFLQPKYEDGIQEVRRSKSGNQLPSARDISVRIHRDRNVELPTVTLMFMQWGQFIDHDIVSTVKTRSFNGSIPRCCDRSGRRPLPPEILHPSCLPIEVSSDDWLLGRFGIQCLEFTRSAPATRVDCDLGWREQMNQATSYLDASTIYGSDLDTADAIRTFRNGKLQYGRPLGNGPLNPPDPPGGELCRSGALSTDCFEGGDGRFGEQSGLVALHTVWIRYHNKVATTLGKMNKHWSDERIFQETRKIVGALIQHITFREFLPIVVGPEVMDSFELNLKRKGFYSGYDERVNPSIANSFGTAAFRFGHSLVQNSYMRFDTQHKPLFNNVSLHQEQENIENIWSLGSVDRLLLGFVNQPSQRRDEFICEELTTNLFRSPNSPFGVDLAAINIQRGRDHGLPSYTSWRKPCGLSEIKDWNDLQNVLSIETAHRLRRLYEHIDDIDLFTAGLAEKPVRGGIVGPTFACIIAQQFSNLRRGDRFWYENPGFHSSFTIDQLNQIRRITLSEILCQTMSEFETVQPFVFLSSDNFRNVRISCDSQLMNRFDLEPWTEDLIPDSKLNENHNTDQFDNDLLQNRDIKDLFDFGDDIRKQRDVWEARKRKRVTTTKKPTTKKRQTTTRTTSRPDLQIPITNVTVHSRPIEKYNNGYYDEIPSQQFLQYKPQQYTTRKYYSIRDKNDYTYLFGRVSSTTPLPRTSTPRRSQTPLEVNIKIQYYPPNPTSPPKRKPQTVYARPQNSNGYGNGYSNANIKKPPRQRPFQTNHNQYSQEHYDDNIVLVNRPNIRPIQNVGYSFKGETYVLQPVKLQNKPIDHSNDENDEHTETLVGYYYKKPSIEKFQATSYKPSIDVDFYGTDNDDMYQTDDQVKYDDTGSYNDDDDEPTYYEDTELEYKNKYDIDRLDNTKPTHKDNEHIESSPYAIAYIERLNTRDNHERLDFRSRLVYKKRFRKPLNENKDDEEDEVSSFVDEDEDIELEEREEKSFKEEEIITRNKNIDAIENEKIRLVNVNLIERKKPEMSRTESLLSLEQSATRWKPYNKSGSYDEDEFVMPDLGHSGHISDEIPKKIIVEKIRGNGSL
ncbi:chorion peroxidase-like isoform X2 [Harmonia axyridis]|nr:chorion peroxidase-like isoform X2 [Harmonia axyridis]